MLSLEGIKGWGGLTNQLTLCSIPQIFSYFPLKDPFTPRPISKMTVRWWPTGLLWAVTSVWMWNKWSVGSNDSPVIQLVRQKLPIIQQDNLDHQRLFIHINQLMSQIVIGTNFGMKENTIFKSLLHLQ